MWVRTTDGKLVNLALVSCIEWFHLGPDSDKRDDIYHVRAQVSRHDDDFYLLARNLTQADAESILNLITKHIGTKEYLDLRDRKTPQENDIHELK